MKSKISVKALNISKIKCQFYRLLSHITLGKAKSEFRSKYYNCRDLKCFSANIECKEKVNPINFSSSYQVNLQPDEQNICKNLKDEIYDSNLGLNFSSYERDVFLLLIEQTKIKELAGLSICEIGGAYDFAMAQFFQMKSKNTVTVVSPDPYTSLSDEEVSEKNIILHKNCYEDVELEKNSYDIIFGCAILEHVIHLEDFFKQVYKTLKPGGWALLHGDPLWNSAWGHHLYIVEDGVSYFMGDKNCPIPHCSHLYMSEKEMLEYLIRSVGIPEKHALRITDEIYHVYHLNRKSIAEIVSAAQISPW